MNETRAPNYELAEKDYMSGMKYKDIAKEYNVTINTVKSWKQRYGWSKDNKKGMHTKNEKVCIQKQNKILEKKAVADEVESVMSNDDLTDKQRLFCIYYSKSFNATQSYQKAYEVDYISACASGPRLLGNARVREEITKIKEQAYSRALLSEEDIFQKYLEIAYADVTAFSTFGKKEIAYVDKAGNEQTATVSYVDLKESTEVDGTLITEISQGKDGVKVKLADRMKALQWLSDHKDMATEEQRVRIAAIKAKIESNDDKPIQITFVKAGDKRG